MEKEIPAVVPDLKLRPAPTETSKSQPNAKRVKFITDLLSLGIQGFSAFYQNRKQNKLKKGMEKLFERQNKLENRVSRLDNDMISLARATLKSLDHFQTELVRQGEHIKHLTNRVKHVETAMQHHEHQITDNRNSIKFRGNILGVLLSDLNRYLLLYESILSELDHLVNVCMCVAAMRAIVTRYTAQNVMWTCMLPRELIWERVASSHTGVTQSGGWP